MPPTSFDSCGALTEISSRRKTSTSFPQFLYSQDKVTPEWVRDILAVPQPVDPFVDRNSADNTEQSDRHNESPEVDLLSIPESVLVVWWPAAAFETEQHEELVARVGE